MGKNAVAGGLASLALGLMALQIILPLIFDVVLDVAMIAAVAAAVQLRK